MKTKSILLLFFISICGMIAVALLIFTLKSRSTFQSGAARKSGQGVPVKTTTVKREDVKEVIGGNFVVAPEALVEIRSLVSSRMANDVKVKIGSRVDAKQKLITLDDTLFRSAYKAAEATLNLAEASRKNATLNLERTTALFSKGYATKLQLEEAQLALTSAETKYVDAVNSLQKAGEDLRNAVITSPVRGIVTELKIDRGQSVKSGDVLMSIATIDSVFIEAAVSEEQVSRVSLGQDASIAFDSYPNLDVQGKVYKIAPVTDPKTRTFSVFIKVPNKGLQFTPGLAGYARLEFHFTGLTIPPLAIIKNQKESSVFVVDNKKAVLKRIKIGLEAFDKTEVVEGLKEGDEVVYYGLTDLKDGDTINREAYGKK